MHPKAKPSPEQAAGPSPFSLRGGSIVAMPTPFINGEVDHEALSALCARHVDAGTNAIVVCATTGEAPALSHAEQRQVIEVAVETVGDRLPIIAGAGTGNTATSIELARQAEQARASALLCVTPYYVRPTQEGVYRHMRAIHDAVNLPLILYDVPARTGCALADDTVIRLSALPRIVGLKDASGDLTRPAQLRPCIKSDFLMLSGDDITQAQHRSAGGDGCISVTANITPNLCAQMQSAWDHGDLDTFHRIASLLAPLSRALFVEANPIPVKRALERQGLISGGLRMPLTPLSVEHEDTLCAVLDAVHSAERGNALAPSSSSSGFARAQSHRVA